MIKATFIVPSEHPQLRDFMEDLVHFMKTPTIPTTYNWDGGVLSFVFHYEGVTLPEPPEDVTLIEGEHIISQE